MIQRESHNLVCNMGTCFCSISMLWDKLPQLLYKLWCQVAPITANGFCFLQAVCLTVCMDHEEDMTVGKLQSSILNHMEANTNYYKQFHTGNILKELMYFKFGTYCDSIVDLIVAAMARALNMNLKIYQQGSLGNIQILEHITNATGKEIHLKFTHDNSNVANTTHGMRTYTEAYRWRGYYRESVSKHYWGSQYAWLM